MLASTPEGTTLDKLAEMADKVMEVAAPSPSGIHAVTTPTLTDLAPASAADVAALRSGLARLEKMVQKLTHSRSRTPRSPRCSPSLTLPPPSFNDSSDNSLCWYHQKFGDRAQHCCQPCTWSSNGQAGH